MLEPSVGKLTRSVLRREGRSNPPDLSDQLLDNPHSSGTVKKNDGETHEKSKIGNT